MLIAGTGGLIISGTALCCLAHGSAHDVAYIPDAGASLLKPLGELFYIQLFDT